MRWLGGLVLLAAAANAGTVLRGSVVFEQTTDAAGIDLTALDLPPGPQLILLTATLNENAMLEVLPAPAGAVWMRLTGAFGSDGGALTPMTTFDVHSTASQDVLIVRLRAPLGGIAVVSDLQIFAVPFAGSSTSSERMVSLTDGGGAFMDVENVTVAAADTYLVLGTMRVTRAPPGGVAARLSAPDGFHPAGLDAGDRSWLFAASDGPTFTIAHTRAYRAGDELALQILGNPTQDGGPGGGFAAVDLSRLWLIPTSALGIDAHFWEPPDFLSAYGANMGTEIPFSVSLGPGQWYVTYQLMPWRLDGIATFAQYYADGALVGITSWTRGTVTGHLSVGQLNAYSTTVPSSTFNRRIYGPGPAEAWGLFTAVLGPFSEILDVGDGGLLPRPDGGRPDGGADAGHDGGAGGGADGGRDGGDGEGPSSLSFQTCGCGAEGGAVMMLLALAALGRYGGRQKVRTQPASASHV